MANKYCMYFNYLPLYRKSVYKKIDEEFDSDWYIDDITSTVKSFDETELKNVMKLPIREWGPFYTVKGLLRLLRKDYDVYLMLGATRNLTLFLFCLIKFLFYRKKRVYLWTHGYYGKESKIEILFWKRPFFTLADGIFTYGDYAKRLMVKDGFNPHTIFPIHNSLDYEEQLNLRKRQVRTTIYSDYFGNTGPVVIFIGRLTKVKNLGLLVDAINALKNNNKIINVVLVGTGSEYQTLVRQVYHYRLQAQFWFYGECYDEEKNAELIYNADICVSPGNVGLTAIHSLMFGTPVITHDNFSLQMPEFEAVLKGKTGDFFKFANVQNLADIIESWLLNHHDREEVRKGCYDEIDRYWNPYYQLNVLRSYLR